MISYLSKFVYVLAAQKYRLLLLICFFLLTSLLDTIGIGLIGPFIALANSPNQIHKHEILNTIYLQSGLGSESIFIALFGLILVLIFYVKGFLSFAVNKYIFYFSYKQRSELCQRLMQTYLTAPYSFHLQKNTANLIHNISHETYGFCNYILLPALNGSAYGVVIFFISILLIYTSPIAFLFVLGILFIPIFLYKNARKNLGNWGKQLSQAQAATIKTINHGLGGLKETKVIGCESYFENQMRHYVEQAATAETAAQTFRFFPRLLVESFLVTFLVGFTSIVLIYQNNTQNITGILGVFALASIRLIPSINQVTTAIASLKNYSYVLNKLYLDLKEIEGLELVKTASKSVMLFKDRIDLNSVTYRYPNSQEPALKNLSLSIKKGESIGLIGKSGAGKTTLVDVILGLLKLENGDIQVDGVSVYQDLRSWQNSIGYIPQTIFLMDDTIEKNIAFGVPEESIDPARMEKAIRDAQLAELITELPDGIKTVVGERGVRLSGGQRQRIGIARVLYHQREILVLDEATSALDNETEKLVNESIKSLSGNKTLIIIAHRLSTIEHCDRIYLLEKGQIAKSGKYQEVVASN
jgi:ABC-type multidrug transport system fused ATPase/permease subunit